MATVTRGGNLLDTGVTKASVYAMVDSATVTNIVNADVAAAAAIVATKLNLTGIDSDMTYAASHHPKRSIILTAAGATVPSSNGAEQAQTDGTNFSYWTLNFDKTTDEKAYWTFIMPDSYDDLAVTTTIYWTTATDTTASSQVQFEVSFAGRAETELLDAALGTATEINDIIPASGYAVNELIATTATEVTAANFPDAGDLVVVKLLRDVDGPGGTDVDDDVKVLAVKIEWGKDQDTD